MIGTKLGPYEITAQIGEGGMGVVYRARDSQLGREVALKVLPEGLTDDPERLARFEREAKLLAQLNHPNIAQIHGLEIQNEIRALVMELVEGPTLAERLESGSLPLDESLLIARQIAEALEEAHEKGIIHRDLKPQNVKASIEGKVKVLDFGLAKAMDPAGAAAGAASASQLAASPTLTLGATVQGVILGTAAYMSPEQAAGNFADRRSDIWSFGVVLYEMLVGRRLFDGETVSHVLAGVLKDEPDFSLLPDGVPPRVQRLVRRCLRKKPRERLQAIGDARLLLDEAMAGLDADENPAPIAAVAAPAPARDWKPLAAGVVAALTLGLAAGWLLLRPRADSAEPLRLELAVPADIQISTSQGQPGLAISDDGRQLALAVVEKGGRTGLLLRNFGELEVRRLEGTEDARAPFFSPDGAWLGYFDRQEMSKVSVTGGKPIRLAEVDERSRGAAWGRDGYIYFSPDTNSGIGRLSEAGGMVEMITELDQSRDERTHRWPDLSPDGEVLIFTSDTATSPTYYDDARIEAVRLADRTRHVLVEGASQARMLTDDLLVYANAGNLFALEIDRRRLAPRSKPVALEQEVATNVGSGGVQFAISRAGPAIWLSGTLSGTLGVPLWFSRDGGSSPASIPERADVWQIELSPDGRQVAVRTIGAAGASASQDQDIWVGDLERGTLTRLTFDEVADQPTWSPDGRRIAYQRDRRRQGATGSNGGREIAWKLADGSGAAEVLNSTSEWMDSPSSFSPDGRQLVFTRWDDAGKGDLWILPIDPAGEPRPFQVSPYEEFAAQVSPDGRWIAYVSNESGRYEVYVRPFPAGSGKWQISPAGGYEPRWSPAGGELFYRSNEGRLLSVAIEGEQAFRASTPRTLWQEAELLGGRNPKSYGVTPDGQRFLALRLFTGSIGTSAVNYSNEWIRRAQRLLAPRK